MKKVDDYEQIREAYNIEGLSIREFSRRYKLQKPEQNAHFLQKWGQLVLLRNALTQTGWKGPSSSSENWRGLIYERLRILNWKAVVNDVRPFLERPAEVDMLTLSNLAQLLHQIE